MFHRTCYFASSPKAFKKKNMLSQGFRGSPIAHPGVRDWTPPCQSNEQAAVQQLLAAFVVALPFRRWSEHRPHRPWKPRCPADSTAGAMQREPWESRDHWDFWMLSMPEE